MIRSTATVLAFATAVGCAADGEENAGGTGDEGAGDGGPSSDGGDGGGDGADDGDSDDGGATGDGGGSGDDGGSTGDSTPGDDGTDTTPTSGSSTTGDATGTISTGPPLEHTCASLDDAGFTVERLETDVVEDIDGVLAQDLDRDGQVDLVVRGSIGADHHYLVLMADGAGGFVEGDVHEFPFREEVLLDKPVTRAIDVTKDGIPDLVAWDDVRIQVFLGLGDGSFLTFPGHQLPMGGDIINIEVADFSGDGHAELIATRQVGLLDERVSLAYVEYDEGTDRFVTQWETTQYDLLAGVRRSWADDFDDDGDADLLQITHRTVGTFENDGAGNFTLLPLSELAPPPTLITAVGLTDYNADGRRDIVEVAMLGFPALGGGAFGTMDEVDPARPYAGKYRVGFGFGDVDGDGSEDLLSTYTAPDNNGENVLEVAYGPAPSFTYEHYCISEWCEFSECPPGEIQVTDFEGNGETDIVLSSRAIWGTLILMRR